MIVIHGLVCTSDLWVVGYLSTLLGTAEPQLDACVQVRGLPERHSLQRSLWWVVAQCELNPASPAADFIHAWQLAVYWPQSMHSVDSGSDRHARGAHGIHLASAAAPSGVPRWESTQPLISLTELA
jgi:hypothetical protein